MHNRFRFYFRLCMLCAVICSVSTFRLSAQDTPVTLSGKQMTRAQAIKEMESKTNYKFIYSMLNFDEDRNISFGKGSQTVKEVLNKLLEDTGCTYSVDGRYIVIHPGADASTQAPTVAVLTKRSITGTVTDTINGTPQEGVTVRLVERSEADRQTTTFANGRFRIEDVAPGRHILKLTSANGQLIRFREVTVPTGSDADVQLYMGRELLIAATRPEAKASAVPGTTTRTTAYFVPNSTDHTIRAFSDEKKSEYSFTPYHRIGKDYLPKSAIKTNLLYLATTTPNLAVEFGLARKWTLDLSAVYNPFRLQKGGINLLWFVQPELRYWFCQRFERHFVGLHGHYGQFNIGQVDFLTTTFKEHRYDGWGAGGGISYGYHLPMGKRWAWEFTIGAGYVYLEYDKYRCYDCDEHIGSKGKHYVGPTKAGISLIYMLK